MKKIKYILLLSLISMPYITGAGEKDDLSIVTAILSELKNSDGLEFRDSKVNKELSYYYFAQIHDSRKLNKGIVKVIWSNEFGKVLKIYDQRKNINSSKVFPKSYELSSRLVDSLLEEGYNEIREEVWYEAGNGFHPGLNIHFYTKLHSYSALFDIQTSHLLHFGDNSSQLMADSSVKAHIFEMDPLTTSQTNYGYNIRDYNDSSYLQIQNQTSLITVPCFFDYSNNEFVLENDYVYLEDIESPTDNIQSFVQIGNITRSDFMFENLMVLYHMDHFQGYLQSLGINSLGTKKLRVDAHALNGADNSIFTQFPNDTNQVRFGTGGVDDAEDADVIIHEYGHELDTRANSGRIGSYSIQRRGLAEAIGDIYCTYYSIKYSNYGWFNIYTWDGHNEFWNGRVSNSTTSYNSAISNIYSIGTIFNSAISTTMQLTNPDSIFKLAVESTFLYDNNSTIVDAAQYVLDLDSMLYGGRFHSDLCSSFELRDILKCVTANTDLTETNEAFQVINSAGFSTQNAPLRILSNHYFQKGHLTISNAIGQIVYEQNIKNGKEVEIPAYTLNTGIYLLHLTTDQDNFSTTLNVQ